LPVCRRFSAAPGESASCAAAPVYASPTGRNEAILPVATAAIITALCLRASASSAASARTLPCAAYLDWEELRHVADLEDAELPAYLDGHPRAAYLEVARAAIRAYRGAKRAR